MEKHSTESTAMTNIAKLRDDVIEAAKAVYGGADNAAREKALEDAVSALRAAEEAAKTPRLRTVREHAEDGLHRNMNRWYGLEDIERFTAARDAEWMAAIRKLRTHYAAASLAPGRNGEFGAPTIQGAILLSDIEALAESAK